MLRFVVAVVLVACSAPQRSSELPVDLVLDGGRIFTGEPTRPWVEAIAIRGDRVVAIGTRAELARLDAKRRIDLAGRLVIPGINDAHLHDPTVFEAALTAPPAFDTKTTQAMLDALAKATTTHPPGTWLHGELAAAPLDDPQLTREALDRVAPAHPVWIDNMAGHALVLNSLAFRTLGMAVDAPPPRGGFHGRDRDGRADGWLFEYARFDARQRSSRATTTAQIAAAAAAFEKEALAFGITSAQTFPLDFDADRLAAGLTGASLRWHIVRVPLGEIVTPPRATPIDPDTRVAISGTKYFLDGTPIERGAAMREPYSDRAERGRLNWERADVRRMLEAARATHDALHLHISGDVGPALVLDVMDELGGDWAAERVVLEHADGLDRRDFERARRLGVVVVQNPAHFGHVELLRSRLGSRLAHWFPLRALVAARIHLAIGSDGPLNPFLNIFFATRHFANPDEALTREQALVAYTQGAAYDEHTEAWKGKLVPGMVADLAVLSQNIFDVEPPKLAETRSVLTMIGGRIAFSTL